MENWLPGNRIQYGGIAWSEVEHKSAIYALETCATTGWFGPNGPFSKEFSSNFAQYVGSRHCYLTNSGSSSLELAVQAMLRTGRWQHGDTIATPALTFTTTVAVLFRNGLVPYVVDVQEGTYVIDPDLLPEKCSGYLVPHLLGNYADVSSLPNEVLVEDSCDALGTFLDGIHTGSSGAIGCFSFYGSHHITTLGCGGALVTDDDDLFSIASQAAQWGRLGSAQNSERYSSKLTSGTSYDPAFTWDMPGYNMQMVEMQAAMGTAQLSRIEEFNVARKYNFEFLLEGFEDLEEFFILPKVGVANADVVWFVFPITVRDTAPFTRLELATHLENLNIETRPVMSGDVRNQPAYKTANILGPEAPNTKAVEQGGLELGCWQGLSTEMLTYCIESTHKFVSGKTG